MAPKSLILLKQKLFGRIGLGAHAGRKRLTEVLNEARFKRVRRATETPTNMVLEEGQEIA
jgi:hypothetical protein